MATVQELRGHRRRFVQVGVTAAAGGALFVGLPLAGLLDGAVGSPTAGTAFATLAALASLAGTVALAIRYREGFGVAGWIGSVLLGVGFLVLLEPPLDRQERR